MVNILETKWILEYSTRLNKREKPYRKNYDDNRRSNRRNKYNEPPRRARLDSDNFPPLVAETNDEPALKQTTMVELLAAEKSNSGSIVELYFFEL